MNLELDKIFDNEKESSRYERKIFLKNGQIFYAAQALKKAGYRKAHNSRHITSLYFDTKNFSFLRDNYDGIKERIKIRVRFYNKVFTEGNLEIKFKKGIEGRKYKVKILLPSGSKDNFIELSERIVREKISKNLFASALIEFSRDYYKFEELIRATLDNELTTYRLHSNRKFLTKRNIFNVMEFKYPVNLDSIFRDHFLNFSCYHFRVTKSSKYANAF